jgi:adenosylcobyric acid synthase
LILESGPDGVLDASGQILTTYVHGLFDAPEAAQRLLEWAGLQEVRAPDIAELRERSLERLADVVERSLDGEKLCVMT